MTSPSFARRPATVLRTLALVLALALGASGCYTAQQREVTQHVNNSRAFFGAPPVRQNLQLTNKAQAWAEHLSRIGRLEHSNLSDGITVRWRSLGENVGYGSTIADVHVAYIRSPGHFNNIMNPAFNYIGTGYASSGGRVYTVQVFMQY
ncbi:MAG: CAP domain-containing protein [Actinomycetota bacterium]